MLYIRLHLYPHLSEMSSKDTLPLFLHDLKDSGQYSDLKIECEGEEYHVHKAIVCSQSEILSHKYKDASEVRRHFNNAAVWS